MYPEATMRTLRTAEDVSQGQLWQLRRERKRTHGSGRMAHLMFEAFMCETIGRVCPVEELKHDEASVLLTALRALPNLGQRAFQW